MMQKYLLVGGPFNRQKKEIDSSKLPNHLILHKSPKYPVIQALGYHTTSSTNPIYSSMKICVYHLHKFMVGNNESWYYVYDGLTDEEIALKLFGNIQRK